MDSCKNVDELTKIGIVLARLALISKQF